MKMRWREYPIWKPRWKNGGGLLTITKNLMITVEKGIQITAIVTIMGRSPGCQISQYMICVIQITPQSVSVYYHSVRHLLVPPRMRQ